MTAEILASGYDSGPAGGPGAGVPQARGALALAFDRGSASVEPSWPEPRRSAVSAVLRCPAGLEAGLGRLLMSSG